MASYLTWLNPFSSSAAKVSTQDIKPVNSLDQHYLTGLYHRINRYGHELNEVALHQLQTYLGKHKVDKNHPAMKNIEQSIAKVKSAVQPEFLKSQAALKKILNPISPLFFTAGNASISTTDETVFCDDGKLSIQEVKKFLEEKGKNLTKLIVTRDDIDDDYFTVVADNCPKLQELNLGDGMMFREKFTDKGLEPIGKLQHLIAFEFIGTEMGGYLTGDGLAKLLSQPHFQKNLQRLSLPSDELNDACLAAVQNCQNLTHLLLPWFSATASIKAVTSALDALGQRNTLQELLLATVLTDPICAALAKFTALKRLYIDCGHPKTQCSSIKQLFSQKSNMEDLKLWGIPVDDAAATEFANLTKLKTLHIKDASQLTKDGLDNVLKNKDFLKELNLQNLLCNIDENSGLMGLKALTSLQLDFTMIAKDWSAMCGILTDKGLQKLGDTYSDQLQELSLKGINPLWPSDTYFTPIGQLKHLKKLIICDCPQFNDSSLQEILTANVQNSLEHLELIGAAITNESIGLLEQIQTLSKLLIANCFGITEKGRQALAHSQALKDRLVALGLGLFALSKDMAVEIIKDFKVLKNLSLHCSEPIPKIEEELNKLASQRSPEVNITFRWESFDNVFFGIHIDYGYPFQDDYLLWP